MTSYLFFVIIIIRIENNSSRWYGMEQKVIVKNQNQCIFLIKESNLDFYLIIPNFKKIKIVLGLFEDVTDEMVKSLPVKSDKAIVIPVVPKHVLAQANIINSQSFRYLEQVLSILINTAYKILSYNQLEVDNQILLNSNSNLNVFQQTFINKYQGRVQLINLFSNESVSIVQEVKPTVMEAKQEITNNLETKVEDVLPTEMPVQEPKQPEIKDEVHEPGFVSYVLLGVLVAVLSLVFLYFII